MNFMPNDKFVKLANRWKGAQVHLDDPRVFDTDIKNLLVTLNSIPGLVTIWSCQGHPRLDKPTPSGKCFARGYVMFGVYNQEALNFLYGVYTHLTANWKHPGDFTLQMKHKGDITIPKTEEGRKDWYPTWGLEWFFESKDQDQLYELLLNAVIATRLLKQYEPRPGTPHAIVADVQQLDYNVWLVYSAEAIVGMYALYNTTMLLEDYVPSDFPSLLKENDFGGLEHIDRDTLRGISF